jgi:ubiquinone/menaquinone biosynthesis C-methylase UbiE
MKNINFIKSLFVFSSQEKAELDEQMRLFQKNSSATSFERSGYGDVYAFFNEINHDYDTDLVNPYWSFSHEILKFILSKFIIEHFPRTQKIKLFDAGAGTGNWSKFVLGLNRNIQGTLFDMNSNMLSVAYSKISSLQNNQKKLIEGNLEVMSDYPSEQSNLILCMHNVIGLGRNTDLILKNLYSHLEIGGLAFIMTQNRYHAFNFTKHFSSDTEVLRVLNDKTVKFKDDMPEMFCYTPEEFKDTLAKAGFDDVTVLGFPVTVYPEAGDTQLKKKYTVEEQLNDQASRDRLLIMEKALCLYPELAYRGGSSLIAICKK